MHNNFDFLEEILDCYSLDLEKLGILYRVYLNLKKIKSDPNFISYLRPIVLEDYKFHVRIAFKMLLTEILDVLFEKILDEAYEKIESQEILNKIEKQIEQIKEQIDLDYILDTQWQKFNIYNPKLNFDNVLDQINLFDPNIEKNLSKIIEVFLTS